jgi:serine/threonine protein kinase
MDEGMLLVGRYRLERQIGAGGMGRVWAAHDTRLGRDVALKVQQFDPAGDRVAFERFQREAQSPAALQHPNVVTIIDSGTDGDTAFLVMELRQDPPWRRMSPSVDPCRNGRPSRWLQPSLPGCRQPTVPAWFTATSSPPT